jgi:hypothetical protein
MKALLITTMIIAGSLVASTGYSQVYVRAHVNLGIAPAPEYAPAPVVVNDPYYADAAFYTYPAWNGHYRDHVYFDHYRPFFERDHARFDRGHERFDRDRGHFTENRGHFDGARGHFEGDRGHFEGNRGRGSDRHSDHNRR